MAIDYKKMMTPAVQSPQDEAQEANSAAQDVLAADVAEVKKLAKAYSVDAINALRQIAISGESEAARVAAANALLAYGVGKPAQSIEHKGNVNTVERLVIICGPSPDAAHPSPEAVPMLDITSH